MPALSILPSGVFRSKINMFRRRVAGLKACPGALLVLKEVFLETLNGDARNVG